jgi:hypothetical protein
VDDVSAVVNPADQCSPRLLTTSESRLQSPSFVLTVSSSDTMYRLVLPLLYPEIRIFQSSVVRFAETFPLK